MIYGTAWKKERTRELVEKALAVGFAAFDAANQPKHYREDLVGEAVKAHLHRGAKREDLFLQTKFTPPLGHDFRIPYDPMSDVSSQVEKSFEKSLDHLGTDYLDAYLLHAPHSSPALGEKDWAAWRKFEELHRAGRVRRIGISNVNRQQLLSLCESAEVAPMIVQNRCFAERGWDREIRELCRSRGVEYQGFSLLTANAVVLRDATVNEIATRHKKTPEQIIYRFAVQAGMVPLTGTTNTEHMKQALEVEQFRLDNEEVKAIETLQG